VHTKKKKKSPKKMINPFAGDGAMGSDFKKLKNVYSGIKIKKTARPGPV
jgi:hypothetical protein